MALHRNDHILAALFKTRREVEQAARKLGLWANGHKGIVLGAMAIINKNDADYLEYQPMLALSIRHGKIADLVASGLLLGLGTAPGVFGVMASGARNSIGDGTPSHSLEFEGPVLQTISGGLNNGQVALLIHLSEDEIRPALGQLTVLGASSVLEHRVPDEVFRHIESTIDAAASSLPEG